LSSAGFIEIVESAAGIVIDTINIAELKTYCGYAGFRRFHSSTGLCLIIKS
jgi:hypothetical protein